MAIGNATPGAQLSPVIIVGRCPPPWGGVSVHVARLARRLAREGKPVLVVDPYARTVTGYIDERPVTWTGLQALRLIASWMRNSTCHVHMSGGKTFYRIAPLVDALTKPARKRVLTIHSGSWNESLAHVGRRTRRFVVSSLRGYDSIICVNERQRVALEEQGLSRAQLHVLPAYLKPDLSGRRVPVQVSELGRRSDALVITSGYGTRTYDYVTVIRAFRAALAHSNTRIGLVIATYTSWDEEYWPEVMAAVKDVQDYCVVTRDLDADVFLAVLATGRIYVRATWSDGDAIAVREAGALGLQVIASSSVPRPAGALLFSRGDDADLASNILRALREPQSGKLPESEVEDRFQELVRIYER